MFKVPRSCWRFCNRTLKIFPKIFLKDIRHFEGGGEALEWKTEALIYFCTRWPETEQYQISPSAEPLISFTPIRIILFNFNVYFRHLLSAAHFIHHCYQLLKMSFGGFTLFRKSDEFSRKIWNRGAYFMNCALCIKSPQIPTPCPFM